MRCRSPVRRLNRVLLPELGAPTTAMLASERRLLAKRDTATEQPELQGIAAERGAGQLDDRSLDETERHQALDLRIRGVDRRDNAFLALAERCERAAVAVHSDVVPGLRATAKSVDKIM